MFALSLFTGIGGFDLGFEKNKISSVAMCEIDSKARSILNLHWPNIPIIKDIKDLDGKDYSEIDIIHGGFPCQNISFSGNRKGLAGSESELWWQYHRIIKESRPKWVIIENVYGLISSGQRRDLGTVIRSLAKLGYMGSYRVLDSRFFGVPQRRRRVYIVAHLGGSGGQKILFESTSSTRGIEAGKQSQEMVSGTIVKSPEPSCFCVIDGFNKSHILPIDSTPIAFHPTQEPIISYQMSNSISVGSSVGGKATSAIFDGKNIRKVTPKECERLQGFPDDWTLMGTDGHISDSMRYRYLGNSVTVNVASWIANRIALNG